MQNTGANFIAGADIGGSHITVGWVQEGIPALVNGESVRIKLDSKGNKESILQAWLAALSELANKGGRSIERLAFAMPGPFDYVQGISLIQGLDKYESLYGLDIKELFAEKLAISPENIRFRNDAEAFLHGELMAAGIPLDRKVMGITLGTGFGSALSQAGNTRDLSIGLSPFKDSIVDDFLTTRWFRSSYEKANRLEMDVQKISELARKGEPLAEQLFMEFSANLTEVLHRILTEYQPDDIILGGNIAKASDLFLPELSRRLQAAGCTVNFHLAQLGEHSAIVGSAYLF